MKRCFVFLGAWTFAACAAIPDGSRKSVVTAHSAVKLEAAAVAAEDTESGRAVLEYARRDAKALLALVRRASALRERRTSAAAFLAGPRVDGGVHASAASDAVIHVRDAVAAEVSESDEALKQFVAAEEAHLTGLMQRVQHSHRSLLSTHAAPENDKKEDAGYSGSALESALEFMFKIRDLLIFLAIVLVVVTLFSVRAIRERCFMVLSNGHSSELAISKAELMNCLTCHYACMGCCSFFLRFWPCDCCFCCSRQDLLRWLTKPTFGVRNLRFQVSRVLLRRCRDRHAYCHISAASNMAFRTRAHNVAKGMFAAKRGRVSEHERDEHLDESFPFSVRFAEQFQLSLPLSTSIEVKIMDQDILFDDEIAQLSIPCEDIFDALDNPEKHGQLQMHHFSGNGNVGIIEYVVSEVTPDLSEEQDLELLTATKVAKPGRH